MKDDELRQTLQQAYDAVEGAPPSFAAMLESAESGLRRNRIRWRVATGVAAGVLALLIGNWGSDAPERSDEYLITDALLNSTTWSAPSDALMPERRFDIYREISFPVPSTNSQEGTLL